MICSSVNLDRFIRPSLSWADFSYSWRSYRGSRQLGCLGDTVPNLSRSALHRALMADTALSGRKVARKPDAIIRQRGRPDPSSAAIIQADALGLPLV